MSQHRFMPEPGADPSATDTESIVVITTMYRGPIPAGWEDLSPLEQQNQLETCEMLSRSVSVVDLTDSRTDLFPEVAPARSRHRLDDHDDDSDSSYSGENDTAEPESEAHNYSIGFQDDDFSFPLGGDFHDAQRGAPAPPEMIDISHQNHLFSTQPSITAGINDITPPPLEDDGYDELEAHMNSLMSDLKNLSSKSDLP